jgi:16S rRNA (guanine966-N2)-methyltransferase
MRITGGLARSIVLKSVAGERLRPATGYLRQAIFSALGEGVAGSYFLDLFAGTGSYGLEALSRGARRGVFVESDPHYMAVLEKNLANVCKSVGISTDCRCWNMDVFRVKTEERFDIIFIDPPYDCVRKKRRELLALGANLLQKNGRLIFEIPQDLTAEAQRDLDDFAMYVLQRLGKKGRNSPAAVIYGKN